MIEQGNIVYTCGCFGGLHKGHKELLDYCARLAGIYGTLVIGLNRTLWVWDHKGYCPHPVEERVEAIERYLNYSQPEIMPHLEFEWHEVEDEVDIENILEDLAYNRHHVYLVKGDEYKGQPITGSNIPGVEVVLVPSIRDKKGRKKYSTTRFFKTGDFEW